VAVSPDAKNVYVASANSIGQATELYGSVVIFSRDPVTGAVVPPATGPSCISSDGTDQAGGLCAMGQGLRGAKTVVVSPDGKNVYVGSGGSNAGDSTQFNAIAIFNRDPATGTLTQPAGQAGCLSDGTDANCSSPSDTYLRDMRSLAISPDGGTLYAAAGADTGDGTSGTQGAVMAFHRNPDGSLIRQGGPAFCITFNPTTNCTAGVGVREPVALTVSPDGKQLYVAASEGFSMGSDNDGAVAIFDRNPATGGLTQKGAPNGCLNKTGSGGSCTSGVKALHDATAIAVSPDNRSLYVAAQGEVLSNGGGSSFGAVSVFSRDIASTDPNQFGRLTFVSCLSADGGDGQPDHLPGSAGTCTAVRSLYEPTGVVVSPNNSAVYVASSDTPSSIAEFGRDVSTGGLAQLPGVAGCVSEDGSDSPGGALTCTKGRGIRGATALAASPDSAAGCNSVYLASEDSASVAVFGREPFACSPPVPTGPTGPVPTVVPATPVLTGGPTVTPSAFFAASSGASIARKTGATVSYTDSEAATTTFGVLLRQRGVKKGSRCVKRRPGRRRGKRCTRLVNKGSFSHTDVAGTNSFHFTGRVSAKKLKPGRYQLNATPSFQGKTGATRSVAFRIRRR
jgi:DNA-binding beta-propeller fold protein YncE